MCMYYCVYTYLYILFIGIYKTPLPHALRQWTICKFSQSFEVNLHWTLRFNDTLHFDSHAVPMGKTCRSKGRIWSIQTAVLGARIVKTEDWAISSSHTRGVNQFRHLPPPEALSKLMPLKRQISLSKGHVQVFMLIFAFFSINLLVTSIRVGVASIEFLSHFF